MNTKEEINKSIYDFKTTVIAAAEKLNQETGLVSDSINFRYADFNLEVKFIGCDIVLKDK